MSKYLVVIEKTSDGYSAYSPDIPGCVATGATREDTEKNMHEAIVFHIEGLRQDKQPLPQNHSSAEFVFIAA